MNEAMIEKAEREADQEMKYQYSMYCAENEDDLPPHKRTGYAEMMYEEADMRRKAAKEEALIEQHEAAIKWAIETGAKS